MMPRKTAIFMGLGFECAGLVTAGVFVGRYLDAHFGSDGLATGLGAIIGVVAWVAHLIFAIRGLAKNDESSNTDLK
jgi:hypothetical protein